MNISDEAVEAAARRLATHKWPTAIGVWESFGQGMKDDFRDQARAALTVAAPFIAAQAWDEGCEKGSDWGEWAAAPVNPEPPKDNPYRSQA